MYMSWKDRYLRWNASEYQGVDEMSMPPSDIWKPDIVLLNALDEDSYMTNLGEFWLQISSLAMTQNMKIS